MVFFLRQNNVINGIYLTSGQERIQTGKSTIMWNAAIVCEDGGFRKNEGVFLGSKNSSCAELSLGLFGKRLKGIGEGIKGFLHIGSI